MRRNTNSFRKQLKVIILLITIGHAVVSPPTAAGREFTSTDGKKIEAQVLKVTPDAVVLERGGSNFTVPLERLTKADQTYLKKWAENERKNRIPKVDIKINSNKRDRREQNAYEDRVGEFKFEIFIDNEERAFDIKKASGTLIVLGKYLYEKGEGIVMERKEFKDITIPDGEAIKLEGNLIKFEYDKSGYTHGQKYDGYLFVLRTGNGKVIKTIGSTSRVENASALIQKLKNGDRFNERTFAKSNSETRR
ncbi:MAG: hypothetical protein P1U86_00335 [Verrucomicrobiales bacterium]|nr:hypothetical protein [Verrucomicrobiales bacterium]